MPIPLPTRGICLIQASANSADGAYRARPVGQVATYEHDTMEIALILAAVAGCCALPLLIIVALDREVDQAPDEI